MAGKNQAEKQQLSPTSIFFAKQQFQRDSSPMSLALCLYDVNFRCNLIHNARSNWWMVLCDAKKSSQPHMCNLISGGDIWWWFACCALRVLLNFHQTLFVATILTLIWNLMPCSINHCCAKPKWKESHCMPVQMKKEHTSSKLNTKCDNWEFCCWIFFAHPKGQCNQWFENVVSQLALHFFQTSELIIHAVIKHMKNGVISLVCKVSRDGIKVINVWTGVKWREKSYNSCGSMQKYQIISQRKR